jgi:hypothetical protein
MNRAAFMSVAIVIALTGCRRTSATSATAAGPAAIAPAPTDYRTLTVQQLETLIGDQTKMPVTLKPAGSTKFTGTRPSPDGTLQLLVTVTVEQDRIVVETKGGGFSSREIITPRGLQVENLR